MIGTQQHQQRRSRPGEMTTTLSSTIALTLSIVLILHAAFSLQHYRALMQDILEDVDGTTLNHIAIPLDVWLELGLGYGVLVLSELSRGSMQPVLSKGKRPRPIVAPAFVTRDFDIYTTRGRGGGVGVSLGTKL
jgi:Membrane magnesium transporter